MGDPRNTIREGELWVDDERKTIIEKDSESGQTTFHRELADGSWGSYPAGESEEHVDE